MDKKEERMRRMDEETCSMPGWWKSSLDDSRSYPHNGRGTNMSDAKALSFIGARSEKATGRFQGYP